MTKSVTSSASATSSGSAVHPQCYLMRLLLLLALPVITIMIPQELVTLDRPWKGKGTLEIVALAGDNNDKLPLPSPQTLGAVPPGILEIIGRCWADVPSDRPTFSSILAHLP